MNNLSQADREKLKYYEAKVIADKIREALLDLDVASNVVYGGNSIQVMNLDETTYSVYIWCRLTWDADLKYCNINLSTVSFSDDLQRKGHLTKIYNTLRKCKYIKYITIGSVCTDEMLNWCKKNKFKQCNNTNDYIIKCN